MSERPKNGADPDATVMLPAGGAQRAPDDDATVMIPAPKADDDATVMIPPTKVDDDATVMIPPAPAPVDADATVMIPAAAAAAEPDPEATIAIPTPGRKRDVEAPALPAAPAAGSEAAKVDLAELGGLNPLVAAANPVLAVAVQIRHALKHPDPEGLRASLRERVESFEGTARASGADDGTVAAASLALCALIDESAGSTPWGAGWNADGLLAERHAGQAGGEKVFQLIEEKIADPAAHRDLLGFFYVCLALGFEGRYRQLPEGREALGGWRARLLEQFQALRPARDGELSGHWRGVQAPDRRPAGAIGFWAAGSAAALLLAALFIGYSISLGSRSDPIARELAQLKAATEPPVARAGAGQAPTPRISEQLAAEIARGEVAVVDAAGQSTIVIRSDRLFASGSARLEAGIEPVVLRVAEALDRVPGTVLVTGHTDDVPIRTARFPSNWELSTERAASVVRLMAAKLGDPSRLRAEGVADAAPAAPNDSAANRARNRRVEIVLRSAP
jgi:type VI secretion system protein ImpK